MKSPRAIKLTALIGVLLFVVAACDSDGEAELTTTSSSIVGATTVPETDPDNGGSGDDTTTTTLVGETVASHEVVLRESTDDGEVLYIVVPPGDYTDVDLENFIGNLMENDEDITSVEVFDDADVVAVFLLEESEKTAADLVLINEHWLVSLEDGNRIIYRGPYEDSGEIAIGS